MRNLRYLLVLIICLSFFSPRSAFAAKSTGPDNNNNAYASISGYVTDSISGLAITDARVVIICGSNRLNTNTNSSGFYEFTTIPILSKKNKLIDSAQIIISAKQYIPLLSDKTLLPGQSYSLDFKLKTRLPYSIIKGRVFDQGSSSGIGAAVVSAIRLNKIISTTTDSQGNYILRIETKIPQIYSIQAKAAQYSESIPQNIRVFPYNTYNLNIPLEIIGLGISVSPDNWPIGNLSPNSVATMRTGQEIRVTNTGNVNQTYSLMLVSPETWIASNSDIGSEQFILNACFSSDINNISWNEQNHALLETLQRCTDIKFAADQTGVNIIPGQQRTLWMQFKAPISTTLRTEQLIEVIINAEMP